MYIQSGTKEQSQQPQFNISIPIFGKLKKKQFHIPTTLNRKRNLGNKHPTEKETILLETTIYPSNKKISYQDKCSQRSQFLNNYRNHTPCESI